MPTYEYECANCGYAFEAFQKITDAPLEVCPKCQKKPRRLISSGAGIIFKGSGFYATDYRKKKKTDTAALPACPAAKGTCHGCPQNKAK